MNNDTCLSCSNFQHVSWQTPRRECRLFAIEYPAPLCKGTRWRNFFNTLTYHVHTAWILDRRLSRSMLFISQNLTDWKFLSHPPRPISVPCPFSFRDFTLQFSRSVRPAVNPSRRFLSGRPRPWVSIKPRHRGDPQSATSQTVVVKNRDNPRDRLYLSLAFSYPPLPIDQPL